MNHTKVCGCEYQVCWGGVNSLVCGCRCMGKGVSFTTSDGESKEHPLSLSGVRN